MANISCNYRYDHRKLNFTKSVIFSYFVKDVKFLI